MKVQVDSPMAKFVVDFEAQQDFLSCMMTGVIAALPCFLEAFMKCLTGTNGPSTGHNPGNRARCD